MPVEEVPATDRWAFVPMACNACHALVHPDELAAHAAWHEGTGENDGETIARWLEALDPAELERVVLEQVGYADNPTKAMLETMAAWARGKPTGT